MSERRAREGHTRARCAPRRRRSAGGCVAAVHASSSSPHGDRLLVNTRPKRPARRYDRGAGLGRASRPGRHGGSEAGRRQSWGGCRAGRASSASSATSSRIFRWSSWCTRPRPRPARGRPRSMRWVPVATLADEALPRYPCPVVIRSGAPIARLASINRRRTRTRQRRPAAACSRRRHSPRAATRTSLYTTCPTGFTCKQGACRKYCYCDTDCADGDTCSEPSGQGGSDLFKLCMNTRP